VQKLKRESKEQICLEITEIGKPLEPRYILEKGILSRWLADLIPNLWGLYLKTSKPTTYRPSFSRPGSKMHIKL